MTSPALAAFCGFAAAMVMVGTAHAQQSVDLFGSAPEPPTERVAPPIHDPANPDLRRLQPPQEAFGALPQDRQGKPDWMMSLRANLIQPRSSVGTAPKPLESIALDIVMKNTAQMPWVKFPHESHGQWLACSNCHDALFAPKAGATAIDMKRIFLGEACGVCHGRVAFTPLAQCERCHSVPQPGQKPWW